MRLYGLIGYPLTHSFSEQYFTEKFAREHLEDCVFQNFPIDTITELPSLLKANSLKGLCVTIPYKEQVLVYATTLSDEVKEIGSYKATIDFGNGKNTEVEFEVVGE